MNAIINIKIQLNNPKNKKFAIILSSFEYINNPKRTIKRILNTMEKLLNPRGDNSTPPKDKPKKVIPISIIFKTINAKNKRDK